jgi:hypothetical protein
MATKAGTARLKQSERAKAATLDELRSRREILITVPSGARLLIRPLNLERHALAGGLPGGLRKIAAMARDSTGVNRVLEQVTEESPNGEASELAVETRTYLDGLIRQMVVEPELPAEVDLDEIFQPVDYHFLLQIAMRERDLDAEGRYLWGAEPLSRWETFREEHRCEPSCEACERVRAAFSASLG